MTGAQCPSCAQVCSIVTVSVTTPVKCTRCGKTWFPDLTVYATEHTTQIAVAMRASIAFRCAVKGDRFLVDFELRTGEERFRITRSRLVGAPGPGGFSAQQPQVDAANFDMAGWTCPVCNHSVGRAATSHPYAQCGTCSELVCGGRTMKGLQGDTFSCHPGCSGGGLLSGSIQSYRTNTADDAGADPSRWSDKPAEGRGM